MRQYHHLLTELTLRPWEISMLHCGCATGMFNTFSSSPSTHPYLTCSLLVEMTVPPSSSSLFHDSAADAYESALHSILSQEGRKAIWREYIHYTRARVTRTGQGFKRLLDCVQRCLVDVECEYVPLHGTESNGEDSTCEDYTFHNEVSLE